LLVASGAAPEGSRIDDGSGLPRNDQVTPQLVARLLSFLYRSEQRDAWIAVLPVGGPDGNLGSRHRASGYAESTLEHSGLNR
jgi:D-alanyl-D-alanine carboxypeptidase